METRPHQSAAAYGMTLLRISLGIMWIAHALLKLWVFTLAGTAAYFASVGLPSVLAYPVFAAELLGGLALVGGVYARQVALALTPIMTVALWLIGDGALAAMRSPCFTLR